MDSRYQKLHRGTAWRGVPPREVGSRGATDDVITAWTGKQSSKHSWPCADGSLHGGSGGRSVPGGCKCLAPLTAGPPGLTAARPGCSPCLGVRKHFSKGEYRPQTHNLAPEPRACPLTPPIPQVQVQGQWPRPAAQTFPLPDTLNSCFIDYAKAFDCVDHNKLWKILKEMGIPDHLTCLLRNLYAGQEAIVRTGHGTTDWFQRGKEVHQGCILSTCLFNFYA